MKTIKAVCTASVLALIMSVSAFAGDIATPGVVCPGSTSGTVSTALPPLSTDGTAVQSDLETSAFDDMLLAFISMF
jgi:hypothetical protein